MKGKLSNYSKKAIKFKIKIVLILLSYFLVACDYSPKEHTITNPDSKTIAKLETVAKIKIPKNSLEVKVYSETGIDQLIMLRIKIHKPEMDTFIKEAGLQDKLRKNYRPFINDYGLELTWWQVKKIKKCLGSSEKFENGTSRKTLIDLDKNYVYMVIML